jgi:uncharacterized protein YdiU (UPF0061 family)
MSKRNAVAQEQYLNEQDAGLIREKAARAPSPAPKNKVESYAAFDSIDGGHPWQKDVPEGYVAYPVRKLSRGNVAYFNFALAREMGLISTNHRNELTPALTEKILETFSIQILNEYDQQNGTRVAKDQLKPKPYMATRYLQLQHANKQGKTSGDGRSIWNGIHQHKGITWDVSSRGTGVTCLAPGAVEANRPLKTGAAEFGYGCGLADVTELFGSAVMSEIFHLNGVPTERVLTIIDLGRGAGIGVRAAPNLIRPAHLFLYLKQGRRDILAQATDYLISRQNANGAWSINADHAKRYQAMLSEVSASFAKFGAALERHYIFAWLDWDGDNVLADAGIIDYGSIRQFGLRHDQYRYDDVTRFSTNLNEQRGKARLTVQVFAQLVDFLETGKRRALEEYANHSAVRDFDRTFDRHLRRLFLKQIGFRDEQVETLLKTQKKTIERLYSAFLTLEKTKTKSGMKKLPDGINRPAIFNMRKFLREYPAMLLKSAREWPAQPQASPALPAEDILDLIASNFAKKSDLRLKGSLREKIDALQSAYQQLAKSACGSSPRASFLKGLQEQAAEVNRTGRITGNGSEFIVEAVMKARRKGMSPTDLHQALELFVASQVPKLAVKPRAIRPASLTSPAGQLYQQLLNLCLEFEEDI